MKTLVLLGLCAGLAAAAPSPAQAAAAPAWPQFRGPGAAGVGSHASLPDTWSATNHVAWKTDLPGRSWSSPIVAGDRVFLTAVVALGDTEPPKKGLYFGGDRPEPPKAEHEWRVFGLELATGQVQWEQTVQRGAPPTPIHLKSSYGAETPVTDGQRVYALFGNVGVFAFTLEGRSVWTHRLAPRATRHGWGTAASPVLHGGRLFLVNDNEDQSELLALDAKTGQELWRVPRDEKSNWATPFLWENGQRTELVTPGSRAVRSYDLDGKVLWSFRGMSGIAIPTPCAGEGLLFVSSGYVGDKLRPLYAIRPGARGDITLPAGETSNAFIAWSNPVGGPYNPSPLFYQGRVYVLYDRGLVSCYDATTGKVLYDRERLPNGLAFTASPWAANGRVFCLNEDGVCYVLRAGDRFELLHTNTLAEDDMCMATPALAGDRLLLRTAARLYCFQTHTPATADVPASIPGTPHPGTLAPFDLVRDGQAACTIVIADHPSPAARLAALELQSHVWKITGVELPVRHDSEPTSAPRILVGDSAATRALGLRGTDFAPQEYLVGFRPDTLVLLGRDWTDTEANRRTPGRTINDQRLADLRHKIDYWKTVGLAERGPLELELPGVFDDQGTCYATYDFLERSCGVRWYGPTDLTCVIPKQTSLSVPRKEVRRAPALKHRNALSTGSWPFLRGQWGAFTDAQAFLHWRRLRLGGEPWAANHTIHRRTIATVLNDPEYQAQGPAKGLNLCYTHPKLVQTLAQKARDFFDGRGELPEGFKALGDYFAIVPEDVSTYCACERCQVLLARGKDRKTGFFSSGEISEYWFAFVNAVAREVRPTHPDKFIATLAYWNYAHPPRGFALEPNVSIAPCLHTCAYAIDDAVRENDMQFYRAWLTAAKAPLFLWNYYHHPMEPALIDKWKCFPNVMVHETARAARMFIQDGVRGIFECGEQDQLEHYVMIKVWDDPGLDTDALLDEFFTRYFGAAARPMNAFYRALERIACDPTLYLPQAHRQTRDVAWKHLGTPERMAHLASLMAEAETLAQSPLDRQRVALWHNSLWQWMRDGRAEYDARTAPAPAR